MRRLHQWAGSAAVAVLFVSATAASGSTFSEGSAAFARRDYVTAARKLTISAEQGVARAQALLGFMYSNGFGVPQSYATAADLYICAAEQGNANAQYQLGLLYDKGFGVPLDYVLAYKWLNLAAARAGKREREYYMRVRNSVASKMSAVQIGEGQWLAVNWAPTSRHYVSREYPPGLRGP